MDAPDLIVVGELVALGPLRRDLAATYARWVNAPEVREGLINLGIDTTERAGFRRIGVRRGGAMSRGERTDVVLMDAVPEDLA